MNQLYSGRAPLLVDTSVHGQRLILAVHCHLGEMLTSSTVLLDTAAEWPVLNTELAREMGVLDTVDLPMTMHTRFGRLDGQLVSIAVRFPAEEGESVTLDVRWFVCEHWPFPSVLGWRCCLELLRFGLDPDQDRFYFGPAEGRNAEESDW